MNFRPSSARLATIWSGALRAAALLSVGGLVVSAAPNTASAQGIGTINGTITFPTGGVLYNPPPPEPLYALSFTRLECVTEGGAWYEQIAASDEPYVLIFVVDLNSPNFGRLFRTSVFSDVDSGESRFQTMGLWGPRTLGYPDDLVVLVQIMEHDESSVDHLFNAVDFGMRSAAVPLVQQSWGHNAIVGALKSQMDLLIRNNEWPQANGSLNMDDQIGGVQEVHITPTDTGATFNGPVQKVLDVNDSSDGHYRAHFELRRG